MVNLANKYRPKSWSEFKGNDLFIDYLKNRIIKGDHPNAIHITGSPGSGKSTLANLYTRAVLDPKRPEGSCEICSDDIDTSNIHYHLVRDSTSTKQVLDDLVRFSYTKPIPLPDSRADQYRRFIVLDEVELIHPTTMSMLLDPLEHAPSTTTWILISMEPDKLPDITREAIESRCKQIPLQRLSYEDITDLISRSGCEPEAASLIASFSNGNPRKAWSMFEIVKGSSLSTKDIESYLLGPLVKLDVLFDNYYKNNLEVVRLICREIEALDKSIVVNKLMAKLSDLREIGLMKSLALWADSKYSYPLEVVFLTNIGSSTELGVGTKKSSKFKLDDIYN